MAETCICRTGLNRFKPWFKPPLAETCQPCIMGHKCVCHPFLVYIRLYFVAL